MAHYVISERADTSFPNVLYVISERADTSFSNVLIHELEVHCNILYIQRVPTCKLQLVNNNLKTNGNLTETT